MLRELEEPTVVVVGGLIQDAVLLPPSPGLHDTNPSPTLSGWAGPWASVYTPSVPLSGAHSGGLAPRPRLLQGGTECGGRAAGACLCSLN